MLLSLIAAASLNSTGAAQLLNELNERIERSVQLNAEVEAVEKPTCLIDVNLTESRKSRSLYQPGLLMEAIVSLYHGSKMNALDAALQEFDEDRQKSAVYKTEFWKLGEISNAVQINFYVYGKMIGSEYSKNAKQEPYSGLCRYVLDIGKMQVSHSYKTSSLSMKLELRKIDHEKVTKLWTDKGEYQIILSDRLLKSGNPRDYTLDVFETHFQERLKVFAINKVKLNRQHDIF